MSPASHQQMASPQFGSNVQHMPAGPVPSPMNSELHDNPAQASFLKRSLGQTEQAKAALEQELHSAVLARDMMSAELSSLKTLCAQLEREADEKTKQHAELGAEVSLVNNLLKNNQKKASEEIAKLSTELEAAIRQRSAAETDSASLRKEAADSNRLLEESAYTNQRMKDLQDALDRSKEREAEAQKTIVEQRLRSDVSQREADDRSQDKSRYADLLSKLWASAAPAAGLKLPVTSHVPTLVCIFW